MPWNKCPKGHKFGKEHDMHDSCDDCPELPYHYCCEMYTIRYLEWKNGEQVLTDEAKEAGWGN